MSSQQAQPEYGAFGRRIESLGMPRPLFWGFVAVFIFMIGDGVEISRLPGYLTAQGGLNGGQATLITGTVYGLGVIIASWFSGTLSAIWGPQRVMQLGAAIWVVFEIIFLLFAINSGSLFFVGLIYGIRGLSYPLFAFGFLVWAQTVTPVNMRGSAAGWFWFAFTGGLPTLGAVVAAASSVPLLGVYNTFWLSLVIVAIGGLIGSFGVREAQGLRPIADEHVENPRSYSLLLEGIDILWRDPRTLMGGVVRIVNTSPEYGFFFFMPFVFVTATAEAPYDGFMGAGQYSILVSLVYAANIGANLFFGIVGDYFGWRRTVTFFGCVGCAIATPLWFFGSLASGSYALCVIFGMLYGVLLAGFVPLSALMPSMVERRDKGAALAILNTGAGGAAVVGLAIPTALAPFIGYGGVVITYSALYLVSAVLTSFIVSPADPGEEGEMEEDAVATTV
ncbi:MAG TPA: MFS transporter [Rubrobacter sp.]|nr:MFS transporter [Rubrobacter sp.]